MDSFISYHIFYEFFELLTDRSPIFSHLSNTLEGLTTVRAFNMQEKFENKFHQMQDLHSGQSKDVFILISHLGFNVCLYFKTIFRNICKTISCFTKKDYLHLFIFHVFNRLIFDFYAQLFFKS